MRTRRSYRRLAFAAFIVGNCVFGANAVLAQGYPSKTIRILTTEIGSASDLSARLIAKELQAGLGQPVVVENRALIGVELAAQAAGDGYTLLHYSNPLWIIPLFRSNVSWDVGRDFSYTCMFAPARTPAPLVSRLSQEVAQGLRVPVVKERLFNVGAEVVGSSPSEAAATIKSETERIRKLISDAGLREN